MKYHTRADKFTTAEHYWMYQFYETIKHNGGKVPAYLQYEVE